MDILYVIGRGSKKDNLELRMSLRSIARFGSNIGKVIVVGVPPKWLSADVSTLVVEDKYSYKHSNILLCIESAVDAGLVSGDFLYSSDDHFYCREVDFAHYPYYYKCPLRDKVSRCDPWYKYHKSLYDTRILCEKHNLPVGNYSQHCNTHMHTDVIQKIKPIIHESYLLQFGVEPTSLIMNAWQTMPNPPQTEKREDVKITTATSLADIWRQIGDRDCFSIADSAFSYGAMQKFFEQEYNIKSVFEAD